MISEKKMILKPILESSDGIHLTAYLVNHGNLIHLKAQLRQVLNEAYEYLRAAQTVEERKKFLEPIESLLEDARIFKNMKHNIGIFRNKSSFRLLNVPVEVERQCYVASSFHVKPLLKWMQFDRDFLILGINPSSAHLYFGNQNFLQKVDSVQLTDKFHNMNGLADWLRLITQKCSPRLFLAGEKALVNGLLKKLKYKNVQNAPIANTFDRNNLAEICTHVRHILKGEAKKTLEQALFEFNLAEEENRGKKNIFQIAKAAMRGNVKKLIIADGINVFGKIDKKTGGLAIHPFDLDHEDDDLLDDLAQAVLASGGEVVIAPRNEIPKGRPILAILDSDGKELEKNKSDVKIPYAKIPNEGRIL